MRGEKHPKQANWAPAGQAKVRVAKLRVRVNASLARPSTFRVSCRCWPERARARFFGRAKLAWRRLARGFGVSVESRLARERRE